MAVAVCISLSGCQHTSALCVLEGRATKPFRVFNMETVGVDTEEPMALTLAFLQFSPWSDGGVKKNR